MKFKLFLLYALCIVSNLLSRDVRHNIVENDKPVTIFAHGLGADYTHAFAYTDLFCSKNWVTFNFPDAPERPICKFSFDKGIYYTGCEHTGVAQTSEMNALEEAIRSAVDHDLVLFGVSRGASTIINVVGRMAQQKEDLSHIKALVLESPFAYCRDAMPAILSMLPGSWSDGIARSIFHEYSATENAPGDWLKYVPAHIPILFITSAEDHVVPATSTKKLYERLRFWGCDNVYYLELNVGKHANIAWDKEGDKYQQLLHAFYKSAGVPCCESLAQQGDSLLVHCAKIIIPRTKYFR